MAGRSTTIPLGMIFKRFYCHKCGEKLVRSSRTRTVKPGDPDYAKHSRVGAHNHLIGDVELTEYSFKCLSCDTATEYEEQCVVSLVQKRFGHAVLTAKEQEEGIESARKEFQKRRTFRKWISRVVTLGVLVLALYLAFRSGGFIVYL